MDARLYLIAHAPAEPQPWFKPTMGSLRPGHEYVSYDGKQSFESAYEAERAVGDDGFRDMNYDAQIAWDENYRRERYLQWPAAWADEQIKRGAK